jgi:hypothetical protein
MIRQIQGQIGDQLGDSQHERERGSINAMDQESDNDRQGLIDSTGKSINIEHIAGVVDQTEIERLRKLIFRSTKGKSYMYISGYEDRAEVGNARRSVYIIVFQNGPHIKEKIERICDAFPGQRY